MPGANAAAIFGLAGSAALSWMRLNLEAAVRYVALNPVRARIA